MSLYNMVYGFNPACVLLLPMLGRKSNEYPRFRDCFLSDDTKHIDVYTRVGGNNRNQGYGEEILYSDENYVDTFDDSFDNTFATYRFKVPERWQEDFNCIVNNELEKVSDAYVEVVKQFYPKLANDGVIDRIFKRDEEKNESM